jgi:DNA-binding protein Alba
MAKNTIITVRNRKDMDKNIKDAIFAFSGGHNELLIRGEGSEISTAVEIAEILKKRMYPGIEVANVELGSRPFRYRNNRKKRNRRNKRNNKDIVSNIKITLKSKTY